jgi:hypothetical protein
LEEPCATIRAAEQGDRYIMAMLAVLGGLIGGAFVLAGLRSVISQKKSKHVVVSLH